jgi:hypothetical protein
MHPIQPRSIVLPIHVRPADAAETRYSKEEIQSLIAAHGTRRLSAPPALSDTAQYVGLSSLRREHRDYVEVHATDAYLDGGRILIHSVYAEEAFGERIVIGDVWSEVALPEMA